MVVPVSPFESGPAAQALAGTALSAEELSAEELPVGKLFAEGWSVGVLSVEEQRPSPRTLVD